MKLNQNKLSYFGFWNTRLTIFAVIVVCEALLLPFMRSKQRPSSQITKIMTTLERKKGQRNLVLKVDWRHMTMVA